MIHGQSSRSLPRRRSGIAVSVFVAMTALTLTACSGEPNDLREPAASSTTSTPEQDADAFFAFVKQRESSIDRRPAPFDNLADGLPYHNAAIVGQVVDVQKGAGCWGEKEGECGEFDDPRAMWQWLAVEVAVEEVMATSKPIEGDTVTARIGISSGLGGDVEKSFAVASSGLKGAGRSVFILTESPDRFHDDLEWYFTLDGGLILPIASDGTLSLPAAEELDGGSPLLKNTPTLDLLRRDIMAKADQIGTTSGPVAYPSTPLSP